MTILMVEDNGKNLELAREVPQVVDVRRSSWPTAPPHSPPAPSPGQKRTGISH